jgi:hypothetical protein
LGERAQGGKVSKVDRKSPRSLCDASLADWPAGQLSLLLARASLGLVAAGAADVLVTPKIRPWVIHVWLPSRDTRCVNRLLILLLLRSLAQMREPLC